QIVALYKTLDTKERGGFPGPPSMERRDEVLWFLDAETEKVLYVSPSYESVWGLSRRALYEDHHAWMDSIHPEDKETAFVFLDPEITGDKAEASYRIYRPDGSIRWIFDQGFVFRDEAGRPVRIIGLAMDVTEQRLLENSISVKPQRHSESS